MINVIIPGFGTTKAVFQHLIDFVGDVTFINLPNYSYDDVDRQLTELTKNDKVNIFGWSLGSIFALKWAINNPDKTASLFLTGATARFCEKENYRNGIKTGKLIQMKKFIMRNHKHCMGDFFDSILQNIDDDEKREYYHTLLMENLPDKEPLLHGLDELMQTDLLNQVAEIKIPVIIVQGKKDRITPKFGSQALFRQLDDAVLIAYDGGHSPLFEMRRVIEPMWRDFICTIV